jgi:Flp pilus assembly protein TadB
MSWKRRMKYKRRQKRIETRVKDVVDAVLYLAQAGL